MILAKPIPVFARWRDASSCDHWHNIAEPEVSIIESVAQLVGVTVDCIQLVLNRNITEGNASQSLDIPRVMLIECTELKNTNKDALAQFDAQLALPTEPVQL